MVMEWPMGVVAGVSWVTSLADCSSAETAVLAINMTAGTKKANCASLFTVHLLCADRKYKLLVLKKSCMLNDRPWPFAVIQITKIHAR